jgi:LPS-assembly protein
MFTLYSVSFFCFRLLVALAFALLAVMALADDEDAINFSADNVSSNTETGVLIATGNVAIEQGNLLLTADKVEYDRNSGTALATGNVVFTDHNENTHYIETLRLDEHFTKAFAEPVISKLSDGSWVSAERVTHGREDGTNFVQSEFTPCNCDYMEGETPAWDLKTSKTRHDPANKAVLHNNVTMHIYDVPVMYFPYLSHPDWTVRRRSGFLPPEFGFSSDLGAIYSQSYYWVTGDTHDVEITPHVFGDKGEALQTHYRQRWDESELDATLIGGRVNTFEQVEQNVAAIDASFNTVLGRQWTTTVDLNRTSQDTFLYRYRFDTSSEELRTSVVTENIGNSRYSMIEAYDIQDLASDRDHEAEPTILPNIFHEDYLDWYENVTMRLRLSAIQLDNDEYTDVRRWSSELYARHDNITSLGNLIVEGRAAAQYRDINTPTNNIGYTGELGQGIAAAGVEWGLPLAFDLAESFAIVEPKVKLVTTKATDRVDKVPNRDSSDFRLDEANLFLLHREQGEDYNITNTRVDAGTSVYLYDEFFGDVTGFVGSSVRVDGSTPSGLNAATDGDRYSDIIANLTIQPEKYYSISMLGRYHPRDFYLNETTLMATLDLEKTRLTASYEQLSQSFFNTANEETEELILTAYQDIGYDWGVSIEHIYDMTDDTRVLTDSSVLLNYGSGLQDCLTISLGYNRDTEDDRDIKPVEEVFIIFNFKYLGSVTTKDERS